MLKVLSAAATKTKFPFDNFSSVYFIPHSHKHASQHHWIIRILRFTMSGQLCQAWIYYNPFIPLLLYGTRHQIVKLSLCVRVCVCVVIIVLIWWVCVRARGRRCLLCAPLLLFPSRVSLNFWQQKSKTFSPCQSKLIANKRYMSFYSFFCACVFFLVPLIYILCAIYTLFAHILCVMFSHSY